MKKQYSIKGEPLPDNARHELESYVRTYGPQAASVTFGLSKTTVLQAALGLEVHRGTRAQVESVLAGLRSAGSVTAMARELIKRGVDPTEAYSRANREIVGR